MAPVRPPGDKDVFADPVSSVVRYLHADRANYLSNRDGKLYFFPPVPSVTEVYRGKRNRFHARRVYCAGFVRPKHETPEEKRARRRIRDRRQAELEYVTINDHRVDPIHSDVLRSGNRLYWRSNYTIKTISPGDLEPRTIATRASSQVWDFDISPDGRVLAVCYRKFGDLNTLLESRISVALYKLHSDGTLGENTAEFAIAGSYCRFSPDGLTLAIISRYEGWPTKKENTEITIIDME
jgi:dipeptidyl aminopeptidase/acylaminoacyl peptidase